MANKRASRGGNKKAALAWQASRQQSPEASAQQDKNLVKDCKALEDVEKAVEHLIKEKVTPTFAVVLASLRRRCSDTDAGNRWTSEKLMVSIKNSKSLIIEPSITEPKQKNKKSSKQDMILPKDDSNWSFDDTKEVDPELYREKLMAGRAILEANPQGYSGSNTADSEIELAYWWQGHHQFMELSLGTILSIVKQGLRQREDGLGIRDKRIVRWEDSSEHTKACNAREGKPTNIREGEYCPETIEELKPLLKQVLEENGGKVVKALLKDKCRKGTQNFILSETAYEYQKLTELLKALGPRFLLEHDLRGVEIFRLVSPEEVEMQSKGSCDHIMGEPEGNPELLTSGSDSEEDKHDRATIHGRKRSSAPDTLPLTSMPAKDLELPDEFEELTRRVSINSDATTASVTQSPGSQSSHTQWSPYSTIGSLRFRTDTHDTADGTQVSPDTGSFSHRHPALFAEICYKNLECSLHVLEGHLHGVKVECKRTFLEVPLLPKEDLRRARSCPAQR